MGDSLGTAVAYLKQMCDLTLTQVSKAKVLWEDICLDMLVEHILGKFEIIHF